ncbi:MAG TPA: ion channel protein Tsx [Anaeromyxobacter sp.]|nr:ion channel protein Tsx [Anaeromyxobacter sp.]
MRPATPPVCAVVVALAAALAPAPARAEFATTNIQLLEGWGFHDHLLGYDTTDGRMATYTLNHFSTWKYGDNFAFVDMYRGSFGSGIDATLYSEWHPRVFVNRLLGTKGNVLGAFRDLGAAFELNVGNGFYAYMAGVGGDLALPIPGVVGLNVYYRHDSVQFPGAPRLAITNDTWQVSPFWTLPFRIGTVPFVFTGFVDVFRSTSGDRLDVMAQPELMVDVLAPFGGPKGTLHAGVEWYLHHYQLAGQNELASVPQALVQWTFH